MRSGEDLILLVELEIVKGHAAYKILLVYVGLGREKRSDDHRL